MPAQLPIDAILDDLRAALRARGRAVLQAPPGAGKTTRVPLALLPDIAGRIVMLEPRRLAARAAAERMAATLGEKVGETVGYRIRGEARAGPATRIEVVTEGILTRMIQSDAALAGVGAVIFDEFHERSLNADLGLALTLEISDALRPDLRLLVMSATLDGAAVSQLMHDAPIVTSAGRSFPVETRWIDRPVNRERRFEDSAAALVMSALDQTAGGVLVFLPGEGEIRRVADRLKGRLPADVALRPLFGAMDFARQRAAIAPLARGRKLVLATAIAETSLTIEDIRVVVDTGRARRARFDAGAGMSRLVTERVTRAEAEQRRGRAGRVAPGTCFRMWTRGEEGALAAFAPPEILTADLAPLALELAVWGAADADLPFLTPPPDGAMAGARLLLHDLGALHGGRLTDHGKALARLPMHPRLGHMLLRAGADAAPLAALLGARDILRGAPGDLTLRLDALRDPRAFAANRPFEIAAAALGQVSDEVRRLRRLAPPGRGFSPAQQAALAYPDRVGLRRKGDAPRFLLSGGKGALAGDGDPLGAARLLVVTDSDGNPREARIRQAIAIAEPEIREIFADRIGWHQHCEWSRRDRRVVARQQEKLGEIVLDDRAWPDAPDSAIQAALLDGIRDLGLKLPRPAQLFCARAQLARRSDPSLPDLSEAGLMAGLAGWLGPHLGDIRDWDGLKNFDYLGALRGLFAWKDLQNLEKLAPAAFVTPLGRKVAVDYGGDSPEIAVRLQELFGLTRHPTVAGAPLKITLLSPASRPVQVTRDLPGFWATSYADVRKDMRGRYPKHPWPEDPTQAAPTTRTRPRGG